MIFRIKQYFSIDIVKKYNYNKKRKRLREVYDEEIP